MAMFITAQHVCLMLACILVEQRWGCILMAAVTIVHGAYPAQTRQEEITFEKQKKES